MIELKVERIGDQVAVILTEEVLAALHLNVGDTLRLSHTADGPLQATTREGWIEDPHARGRAFLRRYNRTFERFEG